MPPNTAHLGSPATGAQFRAQLERCIDDLAELARGDLPAGQFFSEVLRKSLQPGGATRVVLWRKSLEGGWESAGAIPESDPADVSTIADRQTLLNEVAAETQPRVIPAASEVLILSPLRHAGDTVGILETVHPLPGGGNLSASIYQFLAAMCEITADYLSQQELQQLRRAKVLWQQFDHFQQRLGHAPDLSHACAVIANDGRLIVTCDRITVLVRQGRHYRVAAITGIDRPDPRAGGVRSLETLAAVAGEQACWSPSETASDPLRADALERYRRETGVISLGLIPLTFAREKNPAAGGPDVIVVFESFHPDARWSEYRSRAETLVQRSMFSLRSAIELTEIPGLGFLRQLQKLPRVLRRRSVLLVVPTVIAIVVALIAVPVEFTVTGHGELWPDGRRDVFATTSGIVDQILVEHGSEVSVNQPLILLRDPDLEQDIPKIQGEIATKTERLRGIQIARLTGQGSPDAAKVRQLTSEEEELKESLKSLELQQRLIEERQQELTLRSPIAGRVLTWDVDQQLSGRPVERGQALMAIGETNGDWVLEIQVVDKDAGHMLRAQSERGADLDVEFQLASEPGQIHHGKIRDVALVSESDDRTGSHVKVTVAFDARQIEQLRPGTTAVPRIRCGKKSLGYYWLHDLIDAVWIRLMF